MPTPQAISMASADLVERDQQRVRRIRPSSSHSTVSVFDSDGRNSSGKQARARHQLPQHQDERPGSGGGRWRATGRRMALASRPSRICCQMRSRSRPNTSVAIIS